MKCDPYYTNKPMYAFLRSDSLSLNSIALYATAQLSYNEAH